MRSISLIMSLLAGCLLSLSACHGQGSAGHVKQVTALTEVFGDGQKTVAAILEYDVPMQRAALKASDFAVAGRTITRVYANRAPALAALGTDGRYVVIELSPADADAATFTQQGFHSTLKPAQVAVRQLAPVATAAGGRYAPFVGTLASTAQLNPVVDEFTQHTYADAPSGQSIAYNLFTPKHYDASKHYPLVLFIHDAGVLSPDVKTTLVQGLGAVVWATPEAQARHECFVLAPQFDKGNPAGQDAAAAQLREAIVRLVQDVATRYHLDESRLYATGQSMGCMSLIAINIAHPKLFAASFLVAGQWDASQVAPLAADKLWILVSQGDERAFPGMNAITAELEKDGAHLTRATWNGRATPAEFAADVQAVLAHGTPIQYTPLQKGTVVPPTMPDNGGSNHICTWRIAYTIPGIRDWVFQQQRP